MLVVAPAQDVDRAPPEWQNGIMPGKLRGASAIRS